MIAFPGRLTLSLAALTLAAGTARLLTIPSTPEDIDSVHFLRALDRYSLREQRPHWPGYPAYVLTGRLVRLLVPDPVPALHVLSIISITLALWPIAGLAWWWRLAGGGDGTGASLSSFGAALLWCSTPLSWVTGIQIISDPLALLLSLALLALCAAALASRQPAWLAVAAFAGGYLVGVRLAYIPLLCPLAVTAWALRRKGDWSRSWTLLVLGSFLVGTLPWLSWQLATQGGDVLLTGRAHLHGHFSRYGGSILSKPELGPRLWSLMETVFAYGLGGSSPALLQRFAIAAVWGGLLVSGVRRLARAPDSGRILITAWTLPYLLYMFLVHDVSIPRYHLPLVAMASVVAGIGLPVRWWRAVIILAAAASLVGATAGQLAWEQHRTGPVEWRVARYLETGSPAGRVLLIDKTGYWAPFMSWAAPNVQLSMATAGALAKSAEEHRREGHAVFATTVPADGADQWRPVARFCAQPLIYAADQEVWLFQPGPMPRGEGLPACR